MKVAFEYFDEDLHQQAFFDANMNLITHWHENDANYRDEYMSELLAWAGAQVQPLPKGKARLAHKKIKAEVS